MKQFIYDALVLEQGKNQQTSVSVKAGEAVWQGSTLVMGKIGQVPEMTLKGQV